MLESKIIYYTLCNEHIKLVRRGEYILARRLFLFLKNKSIELGLSDIDWKLEEILYSSGLNPTYVGDHFSRYVLNIK